MSEKSNKQKVSGWGRLKAMLGGAESGPDTDDKDISYLTITTRKGDFNLDRADIIWVKGAKNYVDIVTAATTYRVRNTMAGLLKEIDSPRFTPVHRSYIVNLDQIIAVKPTNNGDYTLTTKDGMTLPLSRRYSDQLEKLNHLR